MVGHRNCCIIGCSNSGVILKKWIAIICPTHGCNQGRGSCVCEPPFVLFPFPTLQNTERRQEWIKAVNRKDSNGKNWQPNSDSRICSRHFAGGKPSEDNPYPILNLGYSPGVQTKHRKRPADRSSFIDIRSSKIVIQTSNHAEPAASIDLISQDSETASSIDLLSQDSETSLVNKSKPLSNCDSSQHDESSDCGLDTKITKLEDKIKKLEREVAKYKRQASLWRDKYIKKKAVGFSHKSLDSDKKIKSFTGIPTRRAFNTLFSLVEGSAPKLKYWHGQPSKHLTRRRHFIRSPKKSGPQRKLSSKDECTLTMMKLRLGSTNADLAERFQISQTTVSRIINTWTRFLSKKLSCLIHNPSKEIALQHLPKKFVNKYSNVRHIIDCTEVFIETPKDPRVSAATWSEYKHHHTIKVLISIMPCGSINFISNGWGGRTSDVVITRESGFYDILERNDEVMADKGFTISEDLLVRHCRLHIPPGKRGSAQMRKTDVKKTKEIANLRIFVEQAIRRVKTFRILKHEMPITLLDKFDDIFIICAAICNLYPKLTR